MSDPANPQYGIWVSKFYTDEPGPYLPKPGDKVTIKGYFSTISKFEDPSRLSPPDRLQEGRNRDTPDHHL